MGLYDRDYTQENFQSEFSSSPRMHLNLPQITPVVKWLMIINIAVFIAQSVGADNWLVSWFSVFPVSLPVSLQVWRYVTYQFLHGSLLHIFGNMLGLLFFGPPLERYLTSKRFLILYFLCGIVGGLFYPLLAAVKFLSVAPMIGASGAVLGVLIACAILFPRFIIFFFFFPVPIRIGAIFLILYSVVTILSRGQNAGGEAAHLAGMAAGAVYIFSESWRARLLFKIRSFMWERKINHHRNLQAELDRILQKVHDLGIHSLTSRERKILKEATKAEQMRTRL